MVSCCPGSCCGAARPRVAFGRPLDGRLLCQRPGVAHGHQWRHDANGRTLYRTRAIPLDALLAAEPSNLLEVLRHHTLPQLGLSSLPVMAFMPVGSVAEGLEAPVQLAYLLLLVALIGGGVFVVVRQALIRRELDESAKALGESIRSGDVTSEEYFELGAVLLRKKLFTQATKNLEKAIEVWDGEGTEIAQVHNALGYAYFNLEKNEEAIQQYETAVKLQPGYVSAWNNLGDAYEKAEDWGKAYTAYKGTLAVAPDNEIAKTRAEFLKRRMDRLGIQPKSYKA
ncbi:unnamed protein product [Ostreobium quekettii]|uniref:Uncharacterized protein n=1 Tax=Ostreobium quekettii TaxID=121088 RepID=A0A8S1ITE3_9CHLO|nr:unnamed protein product [Ostreobium quekettii]|eukprot:evm.model.scf_173.3 EVM.evm.TU.scf_173.3   scf_173:15414-18992(-)